MWMLMQPNRGFELRLSVQLLPRAYRHVNNYCNLTATRKNHMEKVELKYAFLLKITPK